MSLRVAVVYTVEEVGASTDNHHGAEQLSKTNAALIDAISQLGHEAHLVPGDTELLSRLKRLAPDVVFNNCTGIHDKSSQPQVAGMLELSKIPFTGSGQAAHVLALYKPLTKIMLLHAGVPTPAFAVARSPEAPLPASLCYPVIVKPEHEGSSIGISQKSVVNSEREVREVIRWVISTFKQPALVEEFVVGSEFTVGVLGREEPRILPPIEILFEHKQGFYSHGVKSADAVTTKCPADIDAALLLRIEQVVLGAFRALGCRDYARIDVRVSSDGTPYVIDVNTLPGLEPGYSDFPKAALAAGISYVDLVGRLLGYAGEGGRNGVEGRQTVLKREL